MPVAELHVVGAAEGGGGLSDVDGDVLAAAGAMLPQVGGGETGGGEGCGAGDADAEGRGQDRGGAAGEADRVRVVGGEAGGWEDGA
jgi:hypothetical protein